MEADNYYDAGYQVCTFWVRLTTLVWFENKEHHSGEISYRHCFAGHFDSLEPDQGGKGRCGACHFYSRTYLFGFYTSRRSDSPTT